MWSLQPGKRKMPFHRRFIIIKAIRVNVRSPLSYHRLLHVIHFSHLLYISHKRYIAVPRTFLEHDRYCGIFWEYSTIQCRVYIKDIILYILGEWVIREKSPPTRKCIWWNSELCNSLISYFSETLLKAPL